LAEISDSSKVLEPSERRLKWSCSEDQALIHCLRFLGICYKEIATHIPGRTPISCKRRFYQIRNSGQLPEDLLQELERSRHKRANALSSTPGQSVSQSYCNGDTITGVSFESGSQSRWVAKCHINGRAVRKTFSVARHGYHSAQALALQARKQLLALKISAESSGLSALRHSNQFYKRV
jgi:hypothetical protein